MTRAVAVDLVLVAVALAFSSSPLESDDLHFMSVALSHAGQPQVILLTGSMLPSGDYIDRLTDERVSVGNHLKLAPYQVRWLEAV